MPKCLCFETLDAAGFESVNPGEIKHSYILDYNCDNNCGRKIPDCMTKAFADDGGLYCDFCFELPEIVARNQEIANKDFELFGSQND